MLKKTIKWLLIVLILLAAAWAALLFIPKSNPAAYRMKVELIHYNSLVAQTMPRAQWKHLF